MTTTSQITILCGGVAVVASCLSIVALAADKPVDAVGAAGVGFAAFVALVTVRTAA